MQEQVKIQLGKGGLTDNFFEEVKKNLKAKKDVKVKFLNSFIYDKDRKEASREILEKLDKQGKLVGNTLLIKNG